MNVKKISRQNISKVLQLWLSDKKLYRSAYISHLISLNDQPAEEVSLIYDNENAFVIEESPMSYHVHGLFTGVDSVFKCFQMLNKKSYLWSLHDFGIHTKQLLRLELRRHLPFQKVESMYRDDIEESELIKSFENDHQELMNSAMRDLLRKAVDNKTYYVVRNHLGKSEFILVYLLNGRSYSGIYIWSELGPVETLSRFIKLQDSLDVDIYESWVGNWNEKSLAVHKLLGYKETGHKFNLIEND